MRGLLNKFLLKENKPTSKGGQTLILIALAFGVLGAVFEGKERYDTDYVKVHEVENAIKPINAADFIALLEDGSNQKVLYIYASWCGTCHIVTPLVLKAMEKKSGEKEFYFVSIDKDASAMAKYIAKKDMAGKFTPYLVNPIQIDALRDGILKLNGKFAGPIPYIAVLKNGKIKADSTVLGLEAAITSLDN